MVRFQEKEGENCQFPENYTVWLLPSLVGQSKLDLPRFKKGCVPTSWWKECQVICNHLLTYHTWLSWLRRDGGSALLHTDLDSISFCSALQIAVTSLFWCILPLSLDSLKIFNSVWNFFHRDINVHFPVCHPFPKKFTEIINCYCLFFSYSLSLYGHAPLQFLLSF